jgi:selenophosphate synthase
MNDVSPRLPAFRLTELAHGGGCGCKLAPAVLQQLLTGQAAALFPQLLVGTETSDDAAVWQLSRTLPTFEHKPLIWFAVQGASLSTRSA